MISKFNDDFIKEFGLKLKLLFMVLCKYWIDMVGTVKQNGFI